MIEIDLGTRANNLLNKKLSVYADGMESKSHGYWSNNRNASKPYEDSLTGKKGEFLVARYIKETYGFDIKPDVEIYSTRGKNWSADLPYATKGLAYPDCHVKTCSQKTVDYAKTQTWTFQLGNGNGRGGTDRLLSTDAYDNDVIALVFVPTWESGKGLIMHLEPWKNIKPHLRDPKSPRLKGIKTCVYTEDLPILERT